MHIMKKLILVFIVCVPVTGWSANLQYTLDVKINPASHKITGHARLKADTDRQIILSVFNLNKLKVDGNEVNTDIDKTINLKARRGKEIRISYEALFIDNKTNFIDKENVILLENWYPQPNVLSEYAFSVTLPNNFVAVSESEETTIKKQNKTKTFNFQFNHPLDALHLAASTRYILKKDSYNNIAIETYFLKEEAHLADIYISYTKKYLEMYEAMLTPYPYQRFAIVENILSTGNSMPTYTLLGQRVIRLPFIVKTSLGHEILHQWFGNSVYIDHVHGNWAEGITTYLADHHYAAMEGKDTAYRKQIMIDYDAYVNVDNVISVGDFYVRHNKAQSTIGYGKTAMVFHGLRERYGDEKFFSALQAFILKNRFQLASWHDIQSSFEKETGEKLYEQFGQWLSREDIPQIRVGKAKLQVEQGQLILHFSLLQNNKAYPLRIPVTSYEGSGKRLHMVDVKDSTETIRIALDDMPIKVVVDESYTLMRQLASDEIPPVLAGILGKEKLTVVVSSNHRARYQPLIDALGVKNVDYASPDGITFPQIEENSFLIADYDNPLVEMLFGIQSIPEDGVRIKVFKNPYNSTERIALLHAKNKAETQAIQNKIVHYGKYTELAFKKGKNTLKTIAETNNGILVLSRPATQALKPDKPTTLNDIIPKLKTSRIIYVGEQHDNFAHHINQLLIIKKIHEAGYELAVGMEMFQRPYQQVVNEYLAGRIDEHTFLQKSEYFTRWKYEYNLYKPIVDYLKQQNIPLVALNIAGDITREVAREGIYGLSDKKTKQIPSSMDFSDEKYQADLNKIYTLHEKQEDLRNFNYFLQAQILWDEGMAATAHQFLYSNPNHKLIILAGNGHVRYKYGIPERLFRRNHEPFTVIVQDEEVEDGIADYVLLTTELKGQESPKLGVIVEEKKLGLVIMGVGHNSPAKKAGLQKGDIINQFANQSIKSVADLKLVLFNSETGNTLKIQVKRDNKTLNKKIELFHFEQFSH